LEEKRQQYFGRVKKMDRSRIPRRALELQFKIKRPMEYPRRRWVLEDTKKRRKSWQEIEKETLW
jgi:hypothetical protein